MEILKITAKCPKFRSFNIKFENKAILKPVQVKEIQTQHQIDLVNLSDMRVEYQGTVYRYVLSIMHIFSRFHWLAPLERKKPSHIVPHLREICRVHGPTRNLQSDRGSEFKKEVKTFCNRWKIRRTCSCAYHPQSQGKIERSHRELRNKIHFDMVKMNSKGVNWVKNLPRYATILNEDAREELGWKSPFEIYYGRKLNAILNEQTQSLSNNETQVTKTRLPNKKDIAKHWQDIVHLRKQAKISGQRVDQHTQNRYKKPTTYSKNEKIFLRFPSGQGIKAPRRRFVCQGKVLKKMKQHKQHT